MQKSFNYNNKTTYLFIKSIYGINKSTSFFVCNFLGFNPYSKISTLSTIEVNKIKHFIEQKYLVK